VEIFRKGKHFIIANRSTLEGILFAEESGNFTGEGEDTGTIVTARGALEGMPSPFTHLMEIFDRRELVQPDWSLTALVIGMSEVGRLAYSSIVLNTTNVYPPELHIGTQRIQISPITGDPSPTVFSRLAFRKFVGQAKAHYAGVLKQCSVYKKLKELYLYDFFFK